MHVFRKTLTGLVTLVAIGAGLVVLAAAAQATTALPSWSLSQDAVADPAGNPIGDQYGDGGIWSYLVGTGTDPASFSLMDNTQLDACGAGVAVHNAGADVPMAVINPTADDHPCRSDIRDQADGVSVHPSPSQDAIVAWTSPIFGNVSFTGTFSDGDPNGGNGFAYTVLRNSTVVQTGVVDNGGAVDTGTMNMFVDYGDTIDVLIDARNGDYSYDTTAVNETVTQLPAPAPTVSSPVPVPQGSTRSVTVTGTDFTPSTQVSLDYTPGVTVGAPTAQTATSITVPVSVASDAPVGARHWVITDPSLTNSVRCKACVLRVTATPTLTSVSPTTVPRGQSVQLTLTGTQFTPGLQVTVSGIGVTVSAVTVDSSTQAEATVYVDPAQRRGTRSVTVINKAGGGRATLTKALTVT